MLFRSPAWRSVATPLASFPFSYGKAYAPLGYEPKVEVGHLAVASTLQFTPFIAAFHFQSHVMAALPQRVVDSWGKHWSRFCEALPGQLRTALHRYPAGFVAGRVSAQAGAATVGALAADTYLTQVAGMERRERDVDNPGFVNDLWRHPGRYLRDFSLLGLAGLAGSPAGTRRISQVLKTSPRATAVVQTSCTVAAAVTSALANRLLNGHAEGSHDVRGQDSVQTRLTDAELLPAP